ncbi:MAG: hypothetical protein JSV88_22605, partial [Candidatus Aminicenantes bacterium]
MKLIDHIIENQINWTFQIFQNVFSMCGMIPLRLYDLNRVDREWKDFYERMGDFDISRLDENPIKVWNELVKRTGKKPENLDLSKQEAPWLTLHSYPLPLWAEAMKVEKLLSCKSAYMYHWLKELEKNEKKKDYRLIIKNLLMIGCKKLDLPGKELYLIVGPVLRYPEKRQTGEAVSKEILEPLISHFEEWTKDSADDLSQPERVRMMDIQGSLRPFLDKRNLEDRLKKAAKSFERLLLCQWPQGEILRRCMCRELARDNWVLHTTAVNEILHKWIREKHKKNFSFEKMSITFPIQAHKSSLAKHNCYLLKALYKDKDWHLQIIPVQEGDRITRPKIEWIKREKKSSFKEGLLNLIKRKLLNRFKESENKKGKEDLFPDGVEDNLVYFWQWIDKRIDSMEISYAQERLIFFEQWFRQEF